MKVKTWVETSQEVDVEISLDDVMAEISALEMPERNSEVVRLLNICVGALMKVPDDIIDKMTHSQRQVVTKAMREQAERYDC